MTDSRRPGPSLYVAVCGRRDAVMPRNVQKDPEASQTWLLKDDIIRRGQIYYAKLSRGKATFIAPRLVPYFNAVWGVRRAEEPKRLSKAAQAVLKVLRREWEMASSIFATTRRLLTGPPSARRWMNCRRRCWWCQAKCSISRSSPTSGVLPSDASRAAAQARQPASRCSRIARSFLTSAGLTVPGELARVTGLARPEAGLGNRALVAEGFAVSSARGVYQLAHMPTLSSSAGADDVDDGGDEGDEDEDEDEAEAEAEFGF